MLHYVVMASLFALAGGHLWWIHHRVVPQVLQGRAAHIVPMDFDPQTLRFLMKADREMPARGPVWYTYDVKTDHLEKIGTFHGYAGFLDPNIFDRAMESPH